MVSKSIKLFLLHFFSAAFLFAYCSSFFSYFVHFLPKLVPMAVAAASIPIKFKTLTTVKLNLKTYFGKSFLVMVYSILLMWGSTCTDHKLTMHDYALKGLFSTMMLIILLQVTSSLLRLRYGMLCRICSTKIKIPDNPTRQSITIIWKTVRVHSRPYT